MHMERGQETMEAGRGWAMWLQAKDHQPLPGQGEDRWLLPQGLQEELPLLTPSFYLFTYLFIIFFYNFFFGCTHSIWKFLAQGLNLSHSCGNTRSFNPLFQARDQTRTSAATQAAPVGFPAHCATEGILTP